MLLPDGLRQIALPHERWRQIPGYDARYYASSLGRLASTKYKASEGRPEILKPAKDGCGYLRTMILTDAGTYATVKMHRMIALAFFGQPAPGFDAVNHKDGDKTNNATANLEWVSGSENSLHAYATGLRKPARGEINGMSTLTLSDVVAIRGMHVYRKVTAKMIAARLGLPYHCVKEVIVGRTWKHVA